MPRGECPNSDTVGRGRFVIAPLGSGRADLGKSAGFETGQARSKRPAFPSVRRDEVCRRTVRIRTLSLRTQKAMRRMRGRSHPQKTRARLVTTLHVGFVITSLTLCLMLDRSAHGCQLHSATVFAEPPR